MHFITTFVTNFVQKCVAILPWGQEATGGGGAQRLAQPSGGFSPVNRLNPWLHGAFSPRRRFASLYSRWSSPHLGEADNLPQPQAHDLTHEEAVVQPQTQGETAATIALIDYAGVVNK